MGAEEKRCPKLVAGRDARVEIARIRADPLARIVFGDVETEAAQVRGDPIGNHALLARRARQSRKLGEEGDELVLGHPAILGRYAVVAAGTASPARSRARPSAAPTNSRKSGAGRVGRDLNSGWNWLATNQGWSGSSMISTSLPSWNVPETTSPASTSRGR